MLVRLGERREMRLMGNGSTAAEQRQFYRLLLEMDWVPPKLRSVVLKEALCLTLREEKRRDNESATMALRYLIKDREQAMKAQGLRPRGGVHDAAVEEIADEHGIEVPALKKRLQRLNRRGREIGGH
jgi:hypothetical protein